MTMKTYRAARCVSISCVNVNVMCEYLNVCLLLCKSQMQKSLYDYYEFLVIITRLTRRIAGFLHMVDV